MFHLHQCNYICKGINTFYETEHVSFMWCICCATSILYFYSKKSYWSSIRVRELYCGDGQCNLPGSSAKFCTYSLMDIESNSVLHLESVDKCEVLLQSPNIEREAVSQAFSYLQAKNVTIEEIITDASSAVRKMLCKLHMCKVFTYIHTTYMHFHTCTYVYSIYTYIFIL